MSIGKPKPTEVKIDGLKVVEFFDDKFVGLIQKEIGNVDFEHFCLYILDEKKEKVKTRMIIAHETKKDKENNIVSVGANNPETFEKLLNVVKVYFKE